MSGVTAEATIAIKAEPADAGPRALRGALLCGVIATAVVVGDVWWVGIRAAVDLNSRAFNPLPLFVVVCAAVIGTIAFVRGVLHTLRFRKFGSSQLTVSEPRLGASLTGLVRTTQDLAPLADFKARLRCDRQTSVRNSRGGRTTGTNCLWESVQSIPATPRSGAGLPIEIPIPRNGLVSGARKRKSGADEHVTWALEITTPLRGLSYYAEFAIPMTAAKPGDDEPRRTETSPRTAGADSRAFAGCDAPRSVRWKWPLRALVMFGTAITVAGMLGVVDEVRSAHVVGHVTAFHSGTLDVAVDGRAVTAHVTHLPDRRQREPGTAIALICGEVQEGTYTCDPDTGLRWWIQTGVGMSVGLGMLVVASVLWRHRRWWT